MNLWLSHPRTGDKDTMLTLSVIAFVMVAIKFMTNGLVITMLGETINFGTIDSSLVGALLTPTLGAYVLRKMKDSPDTTSTTEDKK